MAGACPFFGYLEGQLQKSMGRAAEAKRPRLSRGAELECVEACVAEKRRRWAGGHEA